jgi:hypothetical protein
MPHRLVAGMTAGLSGSFDFAGIAIVGRTLKYSGSPAGTIALSGSAPPRK